MSGHLTGASSPIVVCSPHARRSTYVNDEIRRFAESHGPSRNVSVLWAGIPNNEATPGREEEKAFPDALCCVRSSALDLHTARV